MISRFAAVSLNTRRATPPDFDLMLTADPEAPDFYLFRGYLHKVRKATFLDQPFDVFQTAVMPVAGHHLFIDIHVGQHRLDPGNELASDNHRDALASRLPRGRGAERGSI